jgi:hypothetical protein
VVVQRLPIGGPFKETFVKIKNPAFWRDNFMTGVQLPLLAGIWHYIIPNAIH